VFTGGRDLSIAAEKFGVSIVMIGQFNPTIFSPAWMEKIGLVTAEDIESATVNVIHPDITAFTVGPFGFDSRQDRFAVETRKQPLVQALDAARVLFGDQLPHTPISGFGINYFEHFRLDSPKRRLALGRSLAPLEPWRDWGVEMGKLDHELTSGVVDLTMVQNYHPPGSGQLRVQVQPSVEIEPNDTGVFMLVNDHRIIVDAKASDGAGPAIDKLSELFDGAMSKARHIIDDMKRLAAGLDV
jgi:hypothetical protein